MFSVLRLIEGTVCYGNVELQKGMINHQIIPCCFWTREGVCVVTGLNELMTIHLARILTEYKEFASERDTVSKEHCGLAAVRDKVLNLRLMSQNFNVLIE